jgi:hypothetical protein
LALHRSKRGFVDLLVRDDGQGLMATGGHGPAELHVTTRLRDLCKAKEMEDPKNIIA